MNPSSESTIITNASTPLNLQINNFDLMRFWLAFIVFLSHSYQLSHMAALSILEEVFSSEIAVKSFFIISGFLIFMSYENSKSNKSYFVKRIKRIYPAYFFIILICTFLGSALSSLSWLDYFSSLQVLKYVIANLLFVNFLQPNLPGVFEHNTLQAVNGALWTLKVEVIFYIFVPIAVYGFRKWGRWPLLIIFYFSSLAYSITMQHFAQKTGASFYLELQRQFPGQIIYFIAGATAYYYFNYFVKYAHFLIVLAVFAFILRSWLPWTGIQPLALGIIVIYLAYVVPALGHFNKYGDFSYGIYIVHFPLLQTIIAYNGFNQNSWLTLLWATFMVMMAAFFLWHVVEKRFLRKSSHYSSATSSAFLPQRY